MTTGDRKDVGMVVRLLRWERGWSQAQLADEAGIDAGSVSDCERGLRLPSRRTLERIASAFEVPYPLFEQLVAPCRRVRLAIEQAFQGSVGAEAVMEKGVTDAVVEAMAPYLQELMRLDANPEAEARAWAAQRWALLAEATAEDQALAVEVLAGDDRSWALAERLQTAANTATDPNGETARLASLAAQLARNAPAPARRRRAAFAVTARAPGLPPDAAAARR